MYKLIDIRKIDPSPFQIRKYFDEDKLKETDVSADMGIIGLLINHKKVSYLMGRYCIMCNRLFGCVQDKVKQVCAVCGNEKTSPGIHL